MIAKLSLMLLSALAPLPPLRKGLPPTFKDVLMLSLFGIRMWWAIFQRKSKKRKELSLHFPLMTEAIRGLKLTNLKEKLMIFWIVKRSFGDNVARLIGIGKATETQSFSMLMPLKEGKKNTILGLWNDDGVWCENKDSIIATAVSYFEKIFSISSPSRINEVTCALSRCVTDDMNAELTKTFIRDEVIIALK